MTLDEATTQFWKVKKAYYGRGKGMSTERAIKQLRAVLKVTGPHHPLTNQVNELLEAIIKGDG